MIKAEAGVGVVLDGHERRTGQPFDRTFVPLHHDIGDIEVGEDAKDFWSRIANCASVGGVRTHSNPHYDRAKSFRLAVLDGRKASDLECGVLDAAGPHRSQDLRGDFMPHGVKMRIEDTVGRLGGHLEKASARRGEGEGFGIDVRTP